MLSLREAESERTDSEQARTAMRRPACASYGEAQATAKAWKTRARSSPISWRWPPGEPNIAAEQLQVRATLDISLRDLQVALQSRQTALAE